jgi:CMP-N-acetylneuraminic acid synthetase
MKKIICIIPLRSKSKRIINKNIKKINNIPLSIYSIREALRSKIFKEIVIASDSIKYLNLIKNFFKKKHIKESNNLSFFLRSKKSASSNAQTEIVIEEILKNKKKVDYVFLIQATSPLIIHKDIIQAKKIILKKKFDSIFSSFQNNYFVWHQKKNLTAINYDFKKRPMKQNFKNKILIENGAIYAFKFKGFLKNKNRLFGKIGSVVMPENRSLDIDTQKDFLTAKKIIENNYK